MKIQSPTLIALAIGLFLVSPVLQAQVTSNKPPPEIRKFEMLVGKWKIHEVDEASPLGVAAVLSLETEIRFIHNGFFIEETGKGKGPDGEPYSYTEITYYDTAAHTYRHINYDSNGFTAFGKGGFEGNTWRSNWTQEVNGKTYKCRNVVTVASDRQSWTYDWSYSEDGVTWKPMLKGTVTPATK